MARELGEGRWKPVSQVDIHAELVVASAEVLDEGVSSADGSHCVQPFESAHRPQSGFSVGRDLLRSGCSWTAR
jgi:hypothetical protein